MNIVGPITIRSARREDAPSLYEMLRASAADQGGEDQLCVDPGNLVDDGFRTDPPRFQCLVAECDGKPVGLALYFPIYSTWLSRTGLYLEDLYVDPRYRRRGVARALMAELARIAEEAGWRYIRWMVLRDNANAIRFYESLAAERSAGDAMLIQGEGMIALAKGSTR